MLITNLDKRKQYYQALLAKDQGYIGIFYAGVKTTSVFCIATCRAKKPKYENVEFLALSKKLLMLDIVLVKFANQLKILTQHHQKSLKLSH